MVNNKINQCSQELCMDREILRLLKVCLLIDSISKRQKNYEVLKQILIIHKYFNQKPYLLMNKTDAQIQGQQMLNIAKNIHLLKLKDSSNQHQFIPIPMVLQPIKITPELYAKASKLTQIWAKITHLAALDEQFIMKTLSPCRGGQMIGPLLNIYEEVMSKQREKQLKKPKIDFDRLDYFLEKRQDDFHFFCVEYNLFACGGTGLSSGVYEVQKKLRIHEDIRHVEPIGKQIYARTLSNFYKANQLEGALILVSSRFEVLPYDGDILMSEMKMYGIKCYEIKYQNLQSSLTFDENNNAYLKNGQKVAVILFRAGSSPKYDNHWQIKTKVAFSNVISIPWIGSELVNQKRIQVELSKPAVMRKYISEQEALILQTNIAKMWEFDQQLADPQKFNNFMKYCEEEGLEEFVLKVNAEGGGNNVYGKEGVYKLKAMIPEERKDFVMMRRLYPIQVERNCVRENLGGEIQVSKRLVNFQFSIYAAISSDGEGKICENAVGGHWIRCKQVESLQGGILIGLGLLSSLCFDEQIN